MANETKPLKSKRPAGELIALWRSGVRIFITHAAALFLFLGGALLIAYFAIWGGDSGDEQATDLFMTILPVAASIVSFWFAGRRRGSEDQQDKDKDVR